MSRDCQGIFENLEESHPRILKIGHLTGNETHVNLVINSMKQSTFLKKYLNNDGNPDELSREAQDFLKLLIANTKFKSKTLLGEEEYVHLINTIPIISKCILAIIVIRLDLTENFCLLLPNLPISLTTEMLLEITMCLKFYVPEKRMEYTFAYLKAIIRIVIQLNNKINSNIIKLTSNFKDFMKNMVPLDNTKESSESENTTIMQSYGYTLLYLYRLIQECPLENSNSETFLTVLISACDAVSDKVTLDIYASWEEVLFDDYSLQDTIAIEAYNIKKQLQNYNPAKEMLMKVCSARSRENVIKNSTNISVIVKNVNKSDQYQKLWFEALLKNENVFNNTDSIDCLKTWMKMCTREDVSVFMAHPKRGENSTNKNLILECINILNVADIKLLIQDYYENRNLDDVLFEVDNYKGQLNAVLNKITDASEVEENIKKNIYVLLLLNPQLIIQKFCDRCLQNTVFITRFENLFKFIKSVPKMDGYYKCILNSTLKDQKVSTLNFTNYTNLIMLMLNLDYISKYELISNIIMPEMDSLCQLGNDDFLLYMELQLLNNVCQDVDDDDIPLEFIELLIKVIDTSRTSSFNFLLRKQDNLGVAIQLLLKLNSKIKSTLRSNYTDTYSRLERKHELTTYYCALINGKMEKTFFETCISLFDVHDVQNMVVPLIMILTQSVTEEWIMVIKEIQSKLDHKGVLKLLTNTLQTICEFTAKLSNDTPQSNNLKCCLDQYLVIIKQVLQPACKENEYLLTKNIMYLLACLGEQFRINGLQLINVIPIEHFSMMKHDEKLVFLLLTFKDEVLSEVISNKMLQ